MASSALGIAPRGDVWLKKDVMYDLKKNLFLRRNVIYAEITSKFFTVRGNHS